MRPAEKDVLLVPIPLIVLPAQTQLQLHRMENVHSARYLVALAASMDVAYFVEEILSFSMELASINVLEPQSLSMEYVLVWEEYCRMGCVLECVFLVPLRIMEYAQLVTQTVYNAKVIVQVAFPVLLDLL